MNPTSLVLLKPDALERHLEEVLIQEFKDHGFLIVRQKRVVVDRTTILKHYAEVIQRVPIPDFQDRILTAFLGKPVLCLELASSKPSTIEDIRALVGPTDPAKASNDTLRGRYGQDTMERSSQEKRMLNNLIHASDSPESALHELALWFEKES